MKIRCKVKPNSKMGPKITKTKDERGEIFEVFVREVAIDGKANVAVIKILSEYFCVPKTKINLKNGGKSRVKIFEIVE